MHALPQNKFSYRYLPLTTTCMCFVMVVSGYPFDLPTPGASFFTYAMLAYHLPLIIAFSVRQRTAFVWGGCMLLRLEELRTDKHGVLQVHGSAYGG